VLLVADVLGDATLPRGEREEFRLAIALAARRWRPATPLPALAAAQQDGRGEARR
jgi:hypothetical protein